MLQKNPLFLNIDLTSNSPQVKISSDLGKNPKFHKHSASNPPQLFIQSPQFQTGSEIMTHKHTPTKSQTNPALAIYQQDQKEVSINSRVTNSSHSPVSKKGLIMKTEPDEKQHRTQKTPTKKIAPTVKSFVKNPQGQFYYQIDQKKHSSNNSRSITPKSRYSSNMSPRYQSEKQPTTSKQSGEDLNVNAQIRIYIRAKPTDSPQKAKIKVINQKQILVSTSDDLVKSFEFHRVLDSVSQKQVYLETSKGIVNSAIAGQGSGVVFTYGQTGSGKTYTMGLLQAVEQGLVSLGLEDIFEQLHEKLSARLIESFSVNLSFLQIYMEEITDLLNPDSGALKIREHKDSQMPYVQGVIEVDIQNVEEGYQLIDAGIRHRIVASQVNTAPYHKDSQQKFKQKSYDAQMENKVTFIDLAGSERIKRSNSKYGVYQDGQRGLRFDEAKAINSSLSALGNVIQALGNPQAQHIPFRDSKLTRILQAHMDGNSAVAVICTVSQLQENANETLSTLLFAQRCKEVILKPNLATTHSQSPNKDNEYVKRIQQLEHQLKLLSETNKNSSEFLQKREQEDQGYQSLVAYLLKIIVKAKEYSNSVITSLAKETRGIRDVLDTRMEECGYQRNQSTFELLERFTQNVNQLMREQGSTLEVVEVDELVHQPKQDIIQTIQKVSKSLLADINSLHEWFKAKSSLEVEQVIEHLKLSEKINDTGRWDQFIQYLVAQGVNREKGRISGKNVERELQATQFMHLQFAKAQELFQIKEDAGEGLQARNRLQSHLYPRDEHSFSQKINHLRQYSNNIYLQTKGQVGLNNQIAEILQKENDRIETDRFSFVNVFGSKDRHPPPIYHSPSDEANLSQLMSGKKQNSHLFNDISSLDNDRSQETSKLNILESFHVQNLSKQLDMVDEEDEFQSGHRQPPQPKYLSPLDVPEKKINVSFVKKSEELSKLDTNLKQLSNQVQRLNDDRVGKSTIQTLAGRIQSRQSSRDQTKNDSVDRSRDDSIEVVKSHVAPPSSKKSGTFTSKYDSKN